MVDICDHRWPVEASPQRLVHALPAGMSRGSRFVVHLQNTTAKRLRDGDLYRSVKRRGAHEHPVFTDCEARTSRSGFALRGLAEGIGLLFPHPLLREHRFGAKVGGPLREPVDGGTVELSSPPTTKSQP